MTPTALPTKPVENWEQVRDEWIAAVDQLFRAVETWSKKQDWGTLRDFKKLEESGLGTYQIPRLLVHTIDGRLLLIPVARLTIGSLGVIEYCVLPSYDSTVIARTEEGWFIIPDNADSVRIALTEEAFVNTTRELLKSA